MVTLCLLLASAAPLPADFVFVPPTGARFVDGLADDNYCEPDRMDLLGAACVAGVVRGAPVEASLDPSPAMAPFSPDNCALLAKRAGGKARYLHESLCRIDDDESSVVVWHVRMQGRGVLVVLGLTEPAPMPAWKAAIAEFERAVKAIHAKDERRLSTSRLSLPFGPAWVSIESESENEGGVMIVTANGARTVSATPSTKDATTACTTAAMRFAPTPSKGPGCRFGGVVDAVASWHRVLPKGIGHVLFTCTGTRGPAEDRAFCEKLLDEVAVRGS